MYKKTLLSTLVCSALLSSIANADVSYYVKNDRFEQFNQCSQHSQVSYHYPMAINVTVSNQIKENISYIEVLAKRSNQITLLTRNVKSNFFYYQDFMGKERHFEELDFTPREGGWDMGMLFYAYKLGIQGPKNDFVIKLLDKNKQVIQTETIDNINIPTKQNLVNSKFMAFHTWIEDEQLKVKIQYLPEWATGLHISYHVASQGGEKVHLEQRIEDLNIDKVYSHKLPDNYTYAGAIVYGDSQGDTKFETWESKIEVFDSQNNFYYCAR